MRSVAAGSKSNHDHRPPGPAGPISPRLGAWGVSAGRARVAERQDYKKRERLVEVIGEGMVGGEAARPDGSPAFPGALGDRGVLGFGSVELGLDPPGVIAPGRGGRPEARKCAIGAVHDGVVIDALIKG